MEEEKKVILEIEIKEEKGEDRIRNKKIKRGKKRKEMKSVNKRDEIKENGRVVEVVKRRKKSKKMKDEEIEKKDMVEDIKMVGWLVKKKDLRIMWKWEGDMEKMEIEERKSMKEEKGKMRNIEVIKRIKKNRIVRRRKGRKRKKIGCKEKLKGLERSNEIGGLRMMLKKRKK